MTQQVLKCCEQFRMLLDGHDSHDNPLPAPPPRLSSLMPLLCLFLCFEGKSDAVHLSLKHDNVTKQQFKRTLIVVVIVLQAASVPCT